MDPAKKKKIILVEAPFRRTASSSLAVALLKAILERAGHPTEVLYLNLLFARRVGLLTAEWLSAKRTSSQLGEFVFSAALFGHDPSGVQDYVDEVLARTDALPDMRRTFPDASPAATIARWREEAIAFCDGEGLRAILERDAWMVGFSSSFQQNCASVALLQRLKNARPEVVTIMGGANCEGEMGEELMARFPAIDYIGQGECDHSLVALVDALQRGEDGEGIPGMLSRRSPRSTVPPTPLTSAELEELPYPDFDDYYRQREAHGLHDHLVRTGLAMETARGCWWGAKHHCTFCGLNGGSMGFRSKSPRRVLDEIDWLVDRYRPLRIRMTDNILDMKYFRTVLPDLAEKKPAKLFYEIKPNLTREQVRLMAEAQIDVVQPGIESLSDQSLRLMRKGSTKATNIQLLRWCAEYGVRIEWNYLIGFPGESDDELAEIAEEIESLHHLEPAAGGTVLRVDRFSPYFDSPEEFGLAPLKPHRSYRHVYPFPVESLMRIAYYFDSGLLEQKERSASARLAESMILRWQRSHRRSFLFTVPRRKSLMIVDTRRCARRWVHRLTGLRRAVYEHCDRAHRLPEIARALGESGSPEAIEAAVRSLVRDRLLLDSGGRFLSLGVDGGRSLAFDADPTGEYVPRAPRRLAANLLRAPLETMRRASSHLRQYRRRLRDRSTHRVVVALVRLFSESEPEREEAPRFAE